MRLEFSQITEDYKSPKELMAKIGEHSIIEISIPFESIRITNSNLDIMRDYLEVSFLAENIAKYAQIIDYGDITRDVSFLSFLIECKPTKPEKLAEFLHIYSKFYSKTIDADDDDRFGFYEELEEYESQLEEHHFQFPDLVDSYYANLVNAGYWQIAGEMDDEEAFFKQEYKKHPERELGYWKSAASKKLGIDFYVSSDAWIISREYDYLNILKSYSGIDQELIFDNANRYDHLGTSLILNNFNAIRFTDIKALETARSCGNKILKPNLITSECKFLLSRYADVLVVQETYFHYVFFLYNSKLNFNELSNFKNAVGTLNQTLESLLGISPNIQLDWTGFNDDKFEQLCYDIIYYNPKFDNSTIRKMGKARSRDGGRDITVMTNRLPGYEPELFIFQCKYLNRNTSLTASKIGTAANTIMQYGAKGYGVLTTGVIDATLYDMLDGFAKNFDISTRENWSIYEIERFLSQNDKIRERYFNPE